MQRYFVLAGVEHESNNGRYCHASDVYDVLAKKDGLWLVTPKIDGKQDVIRLDADTQGSQLNLLWQKLYNPAVETTGAK